MGSQTSQTTKTFQIATTKEIKNIWKEKNI
jgi:hypothetical protein